MKIDNPLDELNAGQVATLPRGDRVEMVNTHGAEFSDASIIWTGYAFIMRCRILLTDSGIVVVQGWGRVGAGSAMWHTAKRYTPRSSPRPSCGSCGWRKTRFIGARRVPVRFAELGPTSACEYVCTLRSFTGRRLGPVTDGVPAEAPSFCGIAS